MQPIEHRAREVETGVILRFVAAAALLGTAAVHFALMGEQAGVSAGRGAFFAIAAWIAVGLALTMFRPSRASMVAVVAVNLALVAVWVASGVTDAGIAGDAAPEPWGSTLAVVAVLAGVAIVATTSLLVPRVAHQRVATEVGFAGVGVVIALVGLLSGALFSPAWQDDDSEPVAAISDSGGADAAATVAPGHEHASTGDGQDHEAAGAEHDDHDDEKQAEIAFLFPDGDTKGWEDVENGVEHAHAADVPEHEIPAATRAEQRRQLALTMKAVEAYPTVATAEAAGYRRAGPFTPGLGAHYVGGSMVGAGGITDEQIVRPSTLVYAGTDPDSPIVGFMFISLGGNDYTEGFAGPNDHWHTHEGVCVRASGDGAIDALGADGSISEDECGDLGGSWMAITQSLLHVWTVPGYSDPLGVYAHTNPAVTCPDGTYHTGSMGKLTTCLEA